MSTQGRATFPEKLWEAINHKSPLIRWTDDGKSIVVDEERFEENVMKQFPGLVAIATFANFRRQMRVYKFDWLVREDESLQFSHPCFVRGRPDLLPFLLTGRRPPEDSDSDVKPPETTESRQTHSVIKDILNSVTANTPRRTESTTGNCCLEDQQHGRESKSACSVPGEKCRKRRRRNRSYIRKAVRGSDVILGPISRKRNAVRDDVTITGGSVDSPDKLSSVLNKCKPDPKDVCQNTSNGVQVSAGSPIFGRAPYFQGVTEGVACSNQTRDVAQSGPPCSSGGCHVCTYCGVQWFHAPYTDGGVGHTFNPNPCSAMYGLTSTQTVSRYAYEGIPGVYYGDAGPGPDTSVATYSPLPDTTACTLKVIQPHSVLDVSPDVTGAMRTLTAL